MPRFPVPARRERDDPGSSRRSSSAVGRVPRTGCPTRNAQSRPTTRSASSSGMGFPGYFLVVADFINWAKENGIRVGPGRGSGAGSMAAYAMRITDLDPLQHGLIFERFLNPERKSRCPTSTSTSTSAAASEVIRYVSDKYGDDRVAQIVTYGTIKAKQAVKDSARVLGLPLRDGRSHHQGHAGPRSWARTCRSGQDVRARPTIATTRAADFRNLVRPRPRGQEGRRHRQRTRRPQAPVGCARRRGDHVLRSAGQNLIPIMKREQRRRGHHPVRLSRPARTLGLVKMDFLGLRNLTVLDDALRNIKSNRDDH